MTLSHADTIYAEASQAIAQAQLAASAMVSVYFSAKISGIDKLLKLHGLKIVRYRSAKTGRFVKPSYAKRYPHLTVGGRG